MSPAPAARLRRALRALGPAMGHIAPAEAARAAGGAALGVLAAGLALGDGLGLHVALIAPLGATAFLVFCVPNSPLAQPWSAVVGNTISALVAVAVLRLALPPAPTAALALGAAVAAMAAARAFHPPGGAVALTAALSPDAVRDAGFAFAFAPVMAGTTALVLTSVAYSRATGRRYPFRQPVAPNRHGTADPPPAQRLGLGDGEIAALLEEFRQSANVGVEDFARLIAGAETRAAAHRLNGLACRDVMSRDLVTLPPDAPRDAVAAVFAAHGFHSLPVSEGGRYCGVIFQIHLLRAGPAAATAAALMTTDTPTLAPDAPAGALLPLLADGPVEAVPVLDGAAIVGIVTRTDLVAALAHVLATGAAAPSRRN